MKQKIGDLTDKERDWIARQRGLAQKVVDSYSPAHAGQPLTLEGLDGAFAAWMSTEESDNQMINGIINSIGVAFGQFLVDELGLNWVIATDALGSDLAVYGLPGTGDILVYPANFVAKRWERRETHFLEDSYKRISEQVRSVSQAHSGKNNAKPWWKLW